MCVFWFYFPTNVSVILGGLLGYMNFRHWLSDVLALDV